MTQIGRPTTAHALAPTEGRLSLDWSGRTDVGRRRAHNEDSYLAEAPLFVVADGMGGHSAGDVASAAVVDRLHELTDRPSVDEAAVEAALQRATEDIAVAAEGTELGVGTTATGAFLSEGEHGELRVTVFNVGDSRVYRHVGTELEQLTIDHSLGQELVDRGQLDRADLDTFEQRNVITRAIGAPDQAADSWLMPVTNGERMLICSDGLSAEVGEEGIRAILTMSGRPEAAAEALVETANRNGGRDNITVVVIDVIAGGAEVSFDSSASGTIHTESDDTLPV